MDSVLQDFRIGIRLLARKPAFTAVATLTLALGIGANVAVFTLVNAVLFHPLPVAEPGRLVNVYTQDSTVDIAGFTMLPSSYRNYEDLRDHQSVFDALAFEAPVQVVLTEEDTPRTVSGFVTSANYFDTLGVPPALGRGFTPQEGEIGGAHAVVVLSYSLWSRHYGAEPGIVGDTIRINHHPFNVVGVAPEGFRGTSTLVDADQIWVPASAYELVLTGLRKDRFLERRGLFISVFGRLAAEVGLDEAGAHVEALGASLAEQYPSANANRSLAIGLMTDAAYGATPYRGADESRQARSAASILMIVAALVLLIACVNLANLLLARGADREKEMSIRAELGASPARLVRQLLSESLVLAAFGGTLGLGFAAWGRDLLWALRPPQIGAASVDVSIDARVLGFAFGVTVLTGVLFGLAPALFGAWSRDLNQRLKLGGRQGPAEGRGRLRLGLVASEVALAFVALVAAGLFLRSLTEGQSVDPGFDPEALATVSFDVGAAGYTPERGSVFYEDTLTQIRKTPGVDAAALSQRPPIAVTPFRAIVPEGEVEDPARFGPAVTVNIVSDGYFDALGIALESGRVFGDEDRETTRAVAVVSRAFVARFWQGEAATGRRFRFTGTEELVEIVGVVEDAVVRNVLDDPAPVVYLPLRQHYVPSVVLNVRAQSSVDAVLGSVRARLRALDPSVAATITDESIVAETLADGLWAPRVGAALLGLFGALAVALAAVGVHGVLAHTVSRRTQEVGIRLVFGASRLHIARMLVAQGMVPALLGLATGVIAALALTRYASQLLFRVSPTDAATFGVTVLVLAAAALAACLLSVRRAVRLEPATALRNE